MSMSPPPPPPPPPPMPPMPTGGFNAGPVSPTGQALAEPLMRMIARALDFVIWFIVVSVIAVPIVISEADDAGLGGFGGDIGAGKQLTINVIAFAFTFLWDAVCTKMLGGTPMKLAFGMKVVRADNGGAVGWSHATIRWAVAAVLSLVPLLGGLLRVGLAIAGLVFMFTKPLRQTVSDLAAKTLVVKAR